MKKLVFILAIGLTSFTLPSKTNTVKLSKLVGVWKNANLREPLKEIDFFPNGLINIHSQTDNFIANYKINNENSNDQELISGTISWHPDFFFSAKIDGLEIMDLKINYQGSNKTIRLVKFKDIKSGIQFIK